MKVIRPSTLEEFVGQKCARRVVLVLTTAAKKRNQVVLIFC